MRVIVDSSERNREVIEELQSFPEVEVSFQRLPVGDYQWPGKLIFERKTLADLLRSLRDGRLFRQANRLRKSANPGVLILEGTLRSLIPEDGRRRLADFPARASSSCTAAGVAVQGRERSIAAPAAPRHKKGFSRAVIQGVLIHLAVKLGLPMLRSTGPGETAWLMRATVRQLSPHRPLPRHPFKGPVAYRGQSLEQQQLQLLQQLPGVGPGRAAVLLAAFGTPAAALSADMKTLCCVQGIGKTTATQIRRVAGDVENSR